MLYVLSLVVKSEIKVCITAITLKSNLCADGLVLAEMHPTQCITSRPAFSFSDIWFIECSCSCTSSIGQSLHKELLLLKAAWLDYRCLTDGSTAL